MNLDILSKTISTLIFIPLAIVLLQWLHVHTQDTGCITTTAYEPMEKEILHYDNEENRVDSCSGPSSPSAVDSDPCRETIPGALHRSIQRGLGQGRSEIERRDQAEQSRRMLDTHRRAQAEKPVRSDVFLSRRPVKDLRRSRWPWQPAGERIDQARGYSSASR